MTLYTKEIQKIVKTMPRPFKRFVVDIVEHPTYLEMRIYQELLADYNEGQKLALAEWLYKLRDAIRLTGTECHIQGSTNPVPYRNWEGN